MKDNLTKMSVGKPKSRAETKDLVPTYLDESVKNFEYADWVQMRCSPLGMLISFGKTHPDTRKVMIFSEILLPLATANQVGEIISKQMAEIDKVMQEKVRDLDVDKKGD